MDPRIKANLLRLAARWTAVAQPMRLVANRANIKVSEKYRALGLAEAYESATQDVWDLVGLEPHKPEPRRCLSCGGDGAIETADPDYPHGRKQCPTCKGTGSPDILPVDLPADIASRSS